MEGRVRPSFLKVDVVLYPEGEEEKPIHRIALQEGVRL